MLKWTFVSLLLLVEPASIVLANAFQPGDIRSALSAHPPQWSEGEDGPLCGLYAACNALHMISIQANPEDFLAIRYVGKCGGSTPQELANLVQDAGARATIVTRLSSFDLRTVGCPVIANVRATPSTAQFNHWVTVFIDADLVTVYDGHDKKYRMQMAEFLGIWSGLGSWFRHNRKIH